MQALGDSMLRLVKVRRQSDDGSAASVELPFSDETSLALILQPLPKAGLNRLRFLIRSIFPDTLLACPTKSRSSQQLQKTDGTAWDYEPARFEVARHLELLRAAGSANPVSVEHFEREIESAKAAQYYACMAAMK
jgi:hypothetical protein